ncbi:PAS domain-containing sensor histidine kinase [Pseudoneobacillus rhizosphaerae]|uniref:histidine kinase n=1 Tax=Pseudoneobacillus rhizosphaerae TaxID=2880968 RepID=A0A9C7LAZ2_9BACI|nr:PAS domain-containing sensor histidine kinase [Pseudoneobacillus rhizosphaerae]CAG9608577.1 Sporulation kinase E [Pseudoneobacillus rhizosphaerae]
MITSENNTLSPNHFSYDIFNQILDGIIITNKNGFIVDVNLAFCQYVDLKKESILGYSLSHFVPQNEHYKLRSNKKLLDENGKVRGIIPIHHSRGLSYFDILTTVDSTNGNTISVLRDVTDKSTLKQQTEQYEYIFQDLFIEALDGIIFWDLKGNIINANYAATRIFESDIQDLIGSNLSTYIAKKNDHYEKIVKKLFNTGAVRDEILLIMPNGQKKLLEFSSRLHSVDGFHMTILRNISQRYEMEQELRKSEQKFRKVFEGSLEGLILWNDEKVIIDINQSACQLLNCERHEFLGNSILGIVPECNGNIEKIENMVKLLKKNGKNDGTLIIHLSDDSIKYFEYSSIYHLYSNVNFSVFKDVTEKIEMENRLKKSDTLNVVGELAAGIAHEIRNPMTALKGFIQLLQGEMQESQAMYFQVILSELNRIDSIINEFLILAKPQAVKYSKVDVTTIMKETVDLLTAQAVLYNVQFETYFDQFLSIICCEPNQLKKVFVNLIKNAIEVMPTGGKIVIRIESKDDKNICISIQDEGVGIPTGKLKKLGEPFYTTKERGTGLGLMVSYKIIEEHKGFIKVESVEGVGTTFHIYLPVQ